MSFRLLLDGKKLVIIIDESGNYSSFDKVTDEVIRKNEKVVIDNIVVRDNGKDYVIPDGLNKIISRCDFSSLFNDEVKGEQPEIIRKENEIVENEKIQNEAEFIKQLENAKNSNSWDSVSDEVYQYALAEITLTSSMFVANKEIDKELDFIVSECAYGMNIFKDFFASIRDLVGGRSKAVENTLKDAKVTVTNELRSIALRMGSDAVIAVDLKYVELGAGGKNGMLLVVATGTAVKTK